MGLVHYSSVYSNIYFFIFHLKAQNEEKILDDKNYEKDNYSSDDSVCGIPKPAKNRSDMIEITSKIK